MAMKFALFVAIVVSVVMAFFAAQNSQQAQVSFLGWYFDGPLIIVLLLSFSAGAVAAFLAVLPGGLRKSLEIKKLKASLLECTRKLEAHEKISPSGVKMQSDADPEKAGNTK
jgi:putative membrane protein